MGRRSTLHQPRKTPQQARSRGTWDRILAASARVYAESGYAETTTDQIAEAAGLSVGSLYQYFPNKDAILHVLAMDHIDEADALIREALDTALRDDQPVSTGRWLRPAIDALINVHATSPQLHRVIFDEAPRTPELVARFSKSQVYAVEKMAALLRADRHLDLASPERTAVFVVATLESLTHRFISSEHSIGHRELADELEKMATAYISAQ